MASWRTWSPWSELRTARLLDKRPVLASDAVVEHLRVSVRAQVYCIERVRLADGIAMSFDETYLPLDIGEKIASNDLEVQPIFSLLENKYALPLVEAQYHLEAATADQRVAQALEIAPGSPIFLIERTSYCDGPTRAQSPIIGGWREKRAGSPPGYWPKLSVGSTRLNASPRAPASLGAYVGPTITGRRVSR